MSFKNDAIRRVVSAAVFSIATASVAVAQAPVTGTPASVPAVGSLAPDFTLPGATRYGRLAEPVRLSDFRGKTVVIAFFYQARTKG